MPSEHLLYEAAGAGAHRSDNEGRQARFPLPSPVSARFLRLQILDSYGASGGQSGRQVSFCTHSIEIH